MASMVKSPLPINLFISGFTESVVWERHFL